MKKILSYIKSLITAFLVSITYIFGKKLGDATSAETLAMLRFAISSVCFLPFINYREYKNFNLRNTILIILASFFGIFLYNYLLFVAVNYTSVLNISVVNATVPVLTLLLSSILNLTIPTTKQFIAFLLSFIGVVLVITKGVFTAELLETSTGEIIMFVGVIGWVLYGFIIRALTKDFSQVFTTFITGLIGCLLLFLFSLHTQTIITMHHLNIYQWLYIGYIGSLGTAVVFFMYTGIIERIGPSRANLIIFSSSPIFVALISYFFLAIPLSLWQILGSLLVVGALAFQVL